MAEWLDKWRKKIKKNTEIKYLEITGSKRRGDAH
jgi:hypothetical protein